MKKLLYGYLLLLFVVVPGLGASYTFRICYNGSDDPEVTIPDSITVQSVIHGGSVCWAPVFSATIDKGQYKDVVFDASTSGQRMNCHLVPETANGGTILPISGSWPTFSLGGPSNPDGETWQIKKTKPVVEQRPGLNLPGMESVSTSFSIEWFGEKQEGLHECQIFEAAPAKTMLARPLQVLQQTTEGVALSTPTVAEAETAIVAQPEIIQQESWVDWSKRWGFRIGVMAVLYALARQMPGSTIRSFEGAVGNLGRSARDYLQSYLTPTWGDLDIGLTDQDIMGGQSMFGFDAGQAAAAPQVGPVSVAMPSIRIPEEAPFNYEFQFQSEPHSRNALEPESVIIQHAPTSVPVDLPVLPEPRLEVPRELPPLTIIEPVKEPVMVPQKKAEFHRPPIKQIRQAPGVWTSEYLAEWPKIYTRPASSSASSSGSSSSVSTLSIPATSSSGLSVSVPPSPTISRATTPSLTSAPQTPMNVRRNLQGQRTFSPREQQAILAHIRRATGTPQSPETQPWTRRIRS